MFKVRLLVPTSSLLYVKFYDFMILQLIFGAGTLILLYLNTVPKILDSRGHFEYRACRIIPGCSREFLLYVEFKIQN